MTLRSLAAIVLAVSTCSIASADEVLFKNGDKLTGTIVSAANGKLTIKTAVAGDVTVNLSDVQTFTSTVPVEMKLKDGEVVKAPVNSSDAGTVKVAEGAVAAGANVPLENVDVINPPPVKWTGSIVASGLIARGNTNSDQLAITADAERRSEIDRTTVGAGYLFGREENSDGQKETTKDNWYAKGQYDYFLNKKLYAYANARVEKDNIANLELRFTPGVGLGYQWIESAKMKFSTEGGLTYLYEKYEGQDTEDSIAGRLAYHFDYVLNDKVSFFHNAEYIQSLERQSDYILRGDAGIRADLTKSFFSEFAVQTIYDNTPGPDASRIDLRYLLGVGWKF